MKRSEINHILQSADEFLKIHQFFLPPFAYWTPEEWANTGAEAAEIVENQLGWDITDFGGGDFSKYGLFLFTVRNGRPNFPGGKQYCEKIMIVEENQVTPYHFHWLKMEDIINRGGGLLKIKLYNSTPDEDLDQAGDVLVSLDGVKHTLKAGSVVTLNPGESITLPPYLYHTFWAEAGKCLVGEVSLVNDDAADNRFHKALGRFPSIEEDTPPLHLLVSDYPHYYQMPQAS